MPVVINEFEVMPSDNGKQETAEAAPAAQPAQRPLSRRQIVRLMKVVKKRASRLHAD
jgi:hypothetical protein